MLTWQSIIHTPREASVRWYLSMELIESNYMGRDDWFLIPLRGLLDTKKNKFHILHDCKSKYLNIMITYFLSDTMPNRIDFDTNASLLHLLSVVDAVRNIV